MKIAIFTDTFYPIVNGVVTSIVDLAKGMSDKGHKIYIIAPVGGTDEEEFSYKDIEVLRVPAVDASFYSGFKWSAVFHKSTFNVLKKADIDIVHFMTPVTIALFGILVGKLLKKPMIGTFHTFIHELTYLRQLFPFAGERMQRFTWRYTNSFYNRANLITTPTENAKQILLDNKCKVEIEAVSNGIKLDSFDNSKAAEIKAKYNPDGELILYVGRVAPEKNMICMLTAFRELCKEDSTTKLLVVGDGPSLEECKLFADNEGLKDRVIFLGMIPSADLRVSGIFGACRMFVTASTTETQSITVLEAEANGIPCIGPDAKGIPNVIDNGVNGFVVTPNSSKDITVAMKKLLNDDDLHKKFSLECLDSVKEHDFNKILDEWELRYNRVIEDALNKRKVKVAIK